MAAWNRQEKLIFPFSDSSISIFLLFIFFHLSHLFHAAFFPEGLYAVESVSVFSPLTI